MDTHLPNMKTIEPKDSPSNEFKIFMDQDKIFSFDNSITETDVIKVTN